MISLKNNNYVSLKRAIILIILGVSFSQTLFATPLKLALNWKPEPQFGGFYAAQVLGLYKKYGLDIQIIEGGSGSPTVQMLANEKVDFAIVSAEEIAISQNRNPKNKVVALFAVYQTNPQILMSRKDQGYKSIEEIFKNEGVLALQSGLSYAQYLVKKYQPMKVKLVPYQGGISHLLANKTYSQQGFLTSEPLLAEQAGVPVNSFLISEAGFNPYTTVLAVHEKTLKDSARLKNMVKAVREGWVEYLKDPQATNVFMSQLNKAMDLKTFKQSALLQTPLISTLETQTNGLGTMTELRWNTLLQQLVDLKLISHPVPAKDLYLNL